MMQQQMTAAAAIQQQMAAAAVAGQQLPGQGFAVFPAHDDDDDEEDSEAGLCSDLTADGLAMYKMTCSLVCRGMLLPDRQPCFAASMLDC
jgi:hypothetical protein